MCSLMSDSRKSEPAQLLMFLKFLQKLSFIENRRQIDRVTTPTRAGLRQCRWPRPRRATRLAALACS